MKHPYLLVVFFRHFGWGIIIPISVAWQLQRGLNLAQIGFIVSIFVIIQMVLDVPTGILADKVGRSKSIMAGGIIHIFSVLIFAASVNFRSFLVAAICEGVGWALISGADEAYLFDISKEEGGEGGYKKMLSRVSFADEGGTFLGFLASAFLIHFYTLHLSLLLAALLTFISAAILLLQVKEPIVRVNETTANNDLIASGRSGLAFFISHRIFLILALSLAFLYESGRFLWQPQLLHNGMRLETISLFYAGMSVFSLAGAYAAGFRHFKSTLKDLFLVAAFQIFFLFLIW